MRNMSVMNLLTLTELKSANNITYMNKYLKNSILNMEWGSHWCNSEYLLELPDTQKHTDAVVLAITLLKSKEWKRLYSPDTSSWNPQADISTACAAHIHQHFCPIYTHFEKKHKQTRITIWPQNHKLHMRRTDQKTNTNTSGVAIDGSIYTSNYNRAVQYSQKQNRHNYQAFIYVHPLQSRKQCMQAV